MRGKSNTLRYNFLDSLTNHQKLIKINGKREKRERENVRIFVLVQIIGVLSNV